MKPLAILLSASVVTASVIPMKVSETQQLKYENKPHAEQEPMFGEKPQDETYPSIYMMSRPETQPSEPSVDAQRDAEPEDIIPLQKNEFDMMQCTCCDYFIPYSAFTAYQCFETCPHECKRLLDREFCNAWFHELDLRCECWCT